MADSGLEHGKKIQDELRASVESESKKVLIIIIIIIIMACRKDIEANLKELQVTKLGQFEHQNK